MRRCTKVALWLFVSGIASAAVGHLLNIPVVAVTGTGVGAFSIIAFVAFVCNDPRD
jgi:hypothetical protein